MQNGGYVAVDEECKEGWEDEKEISNATKQKWVLSKKINIIQSGPAIVV